MHEVGLMQNALDLAFTRAESEGAKRIEAIRLRVGALSGAVPESLEFAFEGLKKGTIAEGARLDLDFVPVRCLCRSCRTEFEPGDYVLTCPSCGREDFDILAGYEMNLVSIEVT